MIKQTAFADIADYMDLLLDAICVVDKSNTFRYVSPGAKRVFGYSPHEMVGRSMFDFVHPDDKNTTGQVAEKVNTGDEILHFENRYIRKDGSTAHILWSARWSDRDQMRVGVARDVTKQKQLEAEREQLIKRLEQMALTDALTGLPNRVLFYDRVKTATARAQRDGVEIGLLYLDLDHFKHINDTYGHATGDSLLKAAGERILGAIRATDSAARIGGDEFVVLVDAIDTPNALSAVAEKICHAMSKPLKLPHGKEHITASIGTARWPENGSTIEELLQYADDAMYRAKRSGGNRVAS